MKKIKFILLFMIMILASGCFRRDDMEDITIYTSNYPIYYVTNFLYNDKADIFSIYPSGVVIDKYELTEKQLEDYSQAGLFIYNGLTDEKSYAVDMLNKNNDLKIIDVTLTMEYERRVEELWLDPSNLLMIAQNIKTGFNEYISNYYIISEIEEAYEELKIILSELDVEFKKLGENSSDKTIVVSDDLLLFLEKYGLNVISLEENNDLTDKKIDNVKDLIEDGTVDYIFVLENEDINDTIKSLLNEYDSISPLNFSLVSNLTDSEKNNKVDYEQKIKANIENLKKELY